jgi:ribosomal protein S26
MAGYECTLPNGEVTPFMKMSRYYYVLDRENYIAIRCITKPVYCNACGKIVEAEMCITREEIDFLIARSIAIQLEKSCVDELLQLKKFLATRVSGKKCLDCKNENIVAIEANLTTMTSGIRNYIFIDEEGNSAKVNWGERVGEAQKPPCL